MSFIKELLREMGDVTSAHDAGGHGGHQTTADVGQSRGSNLYNGGVIDPSQAKKKQKNRFKKMMKYRNEGQSNKTMFQNALRRPIPGQVNEDEQTKFDPSAVMSKMDAAEKRSNIGEDTVTFGLKNDEGQIVQVSVRTEQADDFEKALESLLSGEDDDSPERGEDTTSSMEIAEVLYKLHGKFEIVDVVWPNIEGDEQQEQEVEGDNEGSEDEADLEDMDGESSESEDESGDEDEDEDEDDEDEDMVAASSESDDEGGTESQLQAVIDLLRQQAEAQKAEAEAREAEAEREEAKYAAQAASAKVKQEEDILDMEAYNEKKDKAEKEAKKLAKLAKYKHETASDAQDKITSTDFNKSKAVEQQEDVDDDLDDESIDPEELASLIYNRLRTSQ